MRRCDVRGVLPGFRGCFLKITTAVDRLVAGAPDCVQSDG